MEKDAADEDQRLLDAVLERMPDKRRQAFQLHVLAGEKQADVAQILCVPESTVKSWIRLSWEELDAAVKRRRAQQRHGRAQVLTISAAALVERERARTEDIVAGDDFDRMWTKVQRTLQEECSREGQRPARAPSAPSLPPPLLPRPTMGLRTLVGASGISGGVGALIVWALLHGDACTKVNLTIMNSAMPTTGQMASPPQDAGTVPWMPTSASSTAVPFSVAPAPASQGVAPLAVTRAALPTPSRQTALGEVSRADRDETEENLLTMAAAALDRGDVDAARAALDHHAREFPYGKLKVNREVLRQRLPH